MDKDNKKLKCCVEYPTCVHECRRITAHIKKPLREAIYEAEHKECNQKISELEKEVARLKETCVIRKEMNARLIGGLRGEVKSLTAKLDTQSEMFDQYVTESSEKENALVAKLDIAKEAMKRAADQIKRGEWDSYNSGTWTILNDALSKLEKGEV